MPASAVFRRARPIVIGLTLAGCSSLPRGAPAIPAPHSVPMRGGGIAGGQSVAALLLIRRAALGVDVAELAPAVTRAHTLAVSTGGYVEREQVEERSASLTLRVPAAKLDVALDTLGHLGDVTSRSVSAQDATAEAIDAEARLRTLTASRDRLRELLSHASGVSDVITVERELARVQAELESLEGRLAQLRSSAALAEAYVSFHQRPVLGPLGVFFRGVGRALQKLFVIR
jgi:hypothetical protein